MKPIYLCLSLLFLSMAGRAQPGGPVFRTEVRLVEVYATISDHHGRYMDDLPRETFHVLDNGAPQPIVAFENSATELSCAILLDTTGSMTGALPKVKSAIYRLIDEFRDSDWIAVYGFNAGMEMLQDFTRGKAAAKRAVSRTRAEGSTALFDAIARVSEEVSKRRGKKAVIIFTDGQDNASVLNVRGAVERAKKLGIPLYTAAQGEALSTPELLKELKDLARLTGGKAYAINNLSQTSSIFEDISEQLRHTYFLAYKPPDTPSADWRQIQITLSGVRGYQVRAKEGYFP